MAEQEQILVVMRLDGIPPGMPHSRCYAILQETIEATQFSSSTGDLTFTASVEGIGNHAEVRDV
jgi:hypothetical protein